MTCIHSVQSRPRTDVRFVNREYMEKHSVARLIGGEVDEGAEVKFSVKDDALVMK